MAAMYREDLDATRCSHPDHDDAECGGGPLVLGQRCHPRSGCDVMYVDGIVKATCHVCGSAIVTIAVATRQELS